MGTWAVVPVNNLKTGKSRLATVLSQEERESLSRYLLIRTLQVLAHAPDIERTLVVSRDATVMQLAYQYGAYTVKERCVSDLNKALHQATEVAASLGAGSVLVIPTDLPLLQSRDITVLTEANRSGEWMVLAPDCHGEGTNALFVQPPGLIKYNFGPRSLQAHTEQAEAKGLELRICHLPGTQFDVDVPEDLERLRGVKSI